MPARPGPETASRNIRPESSWYGWLSGEKHACRPRSGGDTIAKASDDTGGTAELEIRLAGLKAPTADGFRP
jgi:hypothetical protein